MEYQLLTVMLLILLLSADSEALLQACVCPSCILGQLSYMEEALCTFSQRQAEVSSPFLGIRLPPAVQQHGLRVINKVKCTHSAVNS